MYRIDFSKREGVRPCIALDLDGVIADIATSLEIFLNRNDYYGYDYGYWLYTNTEEDLAMKAFKDPLFWKNMKPFEDAWYQVNYWFSKDIDVHIVTARRSEAAISCTEPWLDAWRINTLRPSFTKLNKKYKVLNEIQPAVMVEDNPLEAIDLIEHGHQCFLRKAWYNQDYWSDLPTIENLYELEI
jgi:hypothetical protein